MSIEGMLFSLQVWGEVLFSQILKEETVITFKKKSLDLSPTLWCFTILHWFWVVVKSKQRSNKTLQHKRQNEKQNGREHFLWELLWDKKKKKLHPYKSNENFYYYLIT